MKQSCCAALLLLVLTGCSEKAPDASNSAPTQTAPPSAVTQTIAETASASDSAPADAVEGVWAGQLRIDAPEGVATLNYVGSESGDFVPMRFRTDSPAGAKILAACADSDLCEIEGSVRFLDEPPPENASAVGEIVRVDRVKKLPADAL